ncbi:MAG: hypothetical protein ACXW27_18375, partial [Allosphingosinicella sp.]
SWRSTRHGRQAGTTMNGEAPPEREAPHDPGAVRRCRDGRREGRRWCPQRIRARLREAEKREEAVEIRFSLPDPWSRHMFIALCRRMAFALTAIRGCAGRASWFGRPETFLHTVLWPEFQESNAALTEYLVRVTRCRRGAGAGEDRAMTTWLNGIGYFVE